MSQNRFTHLHLHSDYSMLDGACRFNGLFDRIKELGMDSVALTDHGNLFGAFDFVKTAKAQGIKPIIGCEMYMSATDRFDKTGPRARDRYHFLLLAETTEGYYSLAKLSSLAYAEGFYYKPRIDLELLEKHHKGLIGLSACLKGPVAQKILQGDEKGAFAETDAYSQILGKDNFFLELMDHGMPEQKKINEGIVRIHKKTGLPLVATNDCHYLTQEDAELQDVLLCISTVKRLDDPSRLKIPDQCYVRSPEEMAQLFGHIGGALENTGLIADRCHAEIPTTDGQELYPKYVPPAGKGDLEYLRELALDGLKRRFPGGYPDEKIYQDRFEYEMSIIGRMGFSSYYLVVWDFIHYAVSKGIPVGPGRGSGAASLVAYALEITDLDPIKHNLVFERFLNPERVDPPDFDIDFCTERRGEVIEYVKKKYGVKNVAQIVTFGTLKAKAAVRDVARVLGMTPGDTDQIAKLIPDTLGITLDEAVKQSAELRSQYETNPQVKRIIDYARRLEGATRNTSTHAAGVVIADQDLSDLIPIYRLTGSGENEYATQYAMKQVIALGLLKMDFLGLKNLTIIDRCMRMVTETKGDVIDWLKIPDDDPETYAMLQRGEAFGVFQLESSGMRDLLRRLKPEKFAEITALIALYRPGPMQYIDEFIGRRHGQIQVAYDHPSIEAILEETYGLIIYQEQVQQIANVMAGFSLGRADVLRRAMGKKDPKEMAAQKERFLAGATERGIDPSAAQKVWDDMAKFAEYGFNKAHSAAYAVVTFRTAYLKAHYPVEYMASLLTNEIGGNNDKIGLYIGKAKEMGIRILPPDVNESNATFTPIGGDIRFGLAAIKNVGGGVVDAIVEERRKNGPYVSLQDLCARVEHKALNARMIESMIRAAAMDSFDANRPQLLAIIADCLEMGNLTKREKAGGQGSLFDELDGEDSFDQTEVALPKIQDWSDREKLQNERDLLGFFVSGHPLDRFAPDIRGFADMPSSKLRTAPDQLETSVIGVVTHVQAKTDRGGNMMAFAELDDFDGSFEVVIFSRTYEDCRHIIEVDAVLWVEGRVSETNGERKILANKIEVVEEMRAKKTKFVDLVLPPEAVTDDNLKRLASLAERHRGRCPLRLRIDTGNGGGELMIQTDNRFKISPSNDLLKDLRVLGLENALTYSTA